MISVIEGGCEALKKAAAQRSKDTDVIGYVRLGQTGAKPAAKAPSKPRKAFSPDKRFPLFVISEPKRGAELFLGFRDRSTESYQFTEAVYYTADGTPQFYEYSEEGGPLGVKYDWGALEHHVELLRPAANQPAPAAEGEAEADPEDAAPEEAEEE